MTVYLIGRPPRCGKTTVARHLARATASAWLQTDYLEAAFAAYAHPDGLAPPQLALPDEVPHERRNDALYARYSATDIIAYYRALAGQTWAGLRPIIEYALFDDEPLILEGFHLDPSDIRRWLAKSDARYPGQVRPIFVVREDPAGIEAALHRGDHRNDWVLTKTQDAATFTRIARMIAEYGAMIRAEAEQGGFAVFGTDGDFAQQLENIVAQQMA